MIRLACVAIGYVFGLFQTGYIYGELKGTDIRQHGSGNAGATNALRTLGWKAGLITLLGDCFKCVFAVLLVRALFAGRYPDENMGVLLGMYAALGVILGHNFPFYLKFKGGKGILVGATMIAVFDWRVFCVAIAAFIVLVAITKWVSLGSIVGSCLVPVMTLYFHWGEDMLLPMMIILVAMVTAVVYMHRSNIVRIAHGEENKFSLHSKKEH